ncbi:snRNA-activating protein complex subunit 4-like [Emydura macquarii macquarii]|uniref:snRNA-activating protein complex subunit 4-like n=1 Tax=Emydura macquarii macquarii TaxID=1129001 RepID=UPI00352A7FBF
MNLVYQEVIQEKIEEVSLLIAQNREQQGPPANEDTREKKAQGIKSFEELLVKKCKKPPVFVFCSMFCNRLGKLIEVFRLLFLFIFLQCSYCYVLKLHTHHRKWWKSREKALLNKSVISDRLQRLLQPKLLKLSYLNQKLEKAKSEMEKQILEKQVKEAEHEIEEINHLPEETLLGNRLDEHDWEKISNMNFDGSRNAKELRKFWQNWEHPTINKREWNEEEIEKLKEIAVKHNCLDWQTIAQELGTNRSAFQCLQKFQAYNKDFKRKEWTKEEDQMLLQLVQEMRLDKLRKPYVPSSALVSGVASDTSVGQVLQVLQNTTEKKYRHQRERFKRKNLERRLLMAVTPWVGNVLLPCAFSAEKVASRQTRADVIRGQLQSVTQASTPLFTLFIQLFQIDTSGCMKVIRERKMKQSELIKAMAGNSRRLQQPSCSSQNSSAVGSHSSPAPESAESTCSSESRREKSKRKLNEEALGDKSKREASQDRPMGAVENGLPQGCRKAQALAGGSAPVVLQNQTFMPHQIALMPSSAISLNPATVESGPQKTSPSTPMICAPALVSSQQNAISLLPTIVAPQRGSHMVHKNIVPITWVVTSQGLIPTPVRALVGIPSQGKPPTVGTVGGAARNQSRTGETSDANTSAPRVPLTPAGASQAPIGCMGVQVLSPQLTEGAPSGKTVCLNHPTLPSSAVSSDPGHNLPSLTPPAPPSFNDLSRTADSSGERSVTLTSLPAEGSALHPSPMLLPQAKPPASTQRADLLCSPSLTGPGKSNNCDTLDGATSNPNVVVKGILAQRSDQLPVCNNVAGTSDHLAAQVTKNRPICPRPLSTLPVDSPPSPPAPSAEKNFIDVSLISLEDEASVKEWLRGKQGIPVPPLTTSLPYLPPFLCNLKTFSRLLLQKKTLEQRVSCLATSEESGCGGAGADLHAVRELVRQKLSENPAYLLLKARFLAAFTLPAVLATLPPPRVITTLSSSWQQSSESDEEESPADMDLREGGSPGKELAEAPLDSAAGTVPGAEDADVANQTLWFLIPMLLPATNSPFLEELIKDAISPV